MKKIYVVHGWDGSPEEPLFRWIKKSLETEDFEVYIPKMPNPSKPEIKSWINRLKAIINLDKDTILVGHSVGCQAVLRYLEALNKNEKLKKVILIAPWMHLDRNTIKEEGEEVVKIAKPWMETPINWKKIKVHCDDFVAIFSDNDPYVPLSNVDMFKKNLNAKILILKNRYHFDPGNNIDKLPELLEFIK